MTVGVGVVTDGIETVGVVTDGIETVGVVTGGIETARLDYPGAPDQACPFVRERLHH